MFKTPKIIVNFKTYKESTANSALELAKICEMEGAIICVDAIDLQKVCEQVKIPVLAQHVDNITYGSHTGQIVPTVVKKVGAAGTLLNHSECRLDFEVLTATIALCKKEKLKTLVCVQTAHEAWLVAQIGPDAIAIEPPELIGGDISVTTANPQIIVDTIKAVGDIDSSIAVLCGAGVKTQEDVAIAISLGCKGVLLASGVDKSEDPAKVLTDLKKGLK
jgi:triosephosphate isomerase